MKNLLILLGFSLLMAYFSQHQFAGIRHRSGKTTDIPMLLMIIALSMYCGLRTAYNDTCTYIQGFQNAPTMTEFWVDPPSLLGNPLFYWFQSFFRHKISDNYHLFFVLIALFTVSCAVRTIRRYTDDFTFSILLFFALGLYMSNFAAMKQSIAMAILALSIPKLLDKKYVQFYLIVFFAMLWHAYAIVFVILPLFTARPWTKITYITIIAVVVVLATFETTITNFLEYAETFGKEISETEVFDTQGINLFRLAVFGVPPLLSFVFKRYLNHSMTRSESLFINMSILSFLIMCLGLSSAANLFARCAFYFEIGTIIVLPWIMNNIFTKRSARFVNTVAAVCYSAFFLFDVQRFVFEYRSIGFIEFLTSLF